MVGCCFGKLGGCFRRGWWLLGYGGRVLLRSWCFFKHGCWRFDAVGGFWVRRAGALTVRRAVASADSLARLVSSSISLLVALIAVFASLNGRSRFSKFAGLHDELPFSAGSRVYMESCLYLLVRRVTR